ncbi:fructose-bisphosphatase class III [Pelomyxa schiedti]|nr:fructose-bisphosphatase class III [Pelomyxa schiedti]
MTCRTMMAASDPIGSGIDPDITHHLEVLELLTKQYPSIHAASNEIVKLRSILTLPKGTEYFMSDIHGEYEAFCHFMRNGSGIIREKIEDLFVTELSEEDRKHLAFIVYYPEHKLPELLRASTNPSLFLKTVLANLIKLTRYVGLKYSQSKMRKSVSPHHRDLILELLSERESTEARQPYFEALLENIVELGEATSLITSLAETIRTLAVDHLHILGDIFDRGPGAHIILDSLMRQNKDQLDIVWGNHEMMWLGAAAGSAALVCHVLRVSLAYGNLETLESAYGIDLLPLATFAMETYADDPCEKFMPKISEVLPADQPYIPSSKVPTIGEKRLLAKMHKAVAILQFKLEGQLIHRRPEFDMGNRLLLDKVDPATGTIQIAGNQYHLIDTLFPTVSLNSTSSSPCTCVWCSSSDRESVTLQGTPVCPRTPLPSAYSLTPSESLLVDKLVGSFLSSSKLQQHARFLFCRGSMYLKYNGNLLFHGGIPLNSDGALQKLHIEGQVYEGKELMDKLERTVRAGYFLPTGHPQKSFGQDTMWYLWVGEFSPLYGRKKMATFERLFIREEATWAEGHTPYYTFRDKITAVESILQNFGLEPNSGHIINGHVPVKVTRGESPVKASGKLLVIDGGMSKAYQKETGIAGYTLVYNSWGLMLISHQPFVSVMRAIEKEIDIVSVARVIERNEEPSPSSVSEGVESSSLPGGTTSVVKLAPHKRIRVADTDQGKKVAAQIKYLLMLRAAYQHGYLKELS